MIKTTMDLFRIQLESHGFTVPFDIRIGDVLPKEIELCEFFSPGMFKLKVKTKACLESACKKHGWVYMISKLFGKETVYKVVID